jgi:hypothetical protein
MKKCSYCGKEYPDDAVACAIDNQPLDNGKPPNLPDSETSVIHDSVGEVSMESCVLCGSLSPTRFNFHSPQTVIQYTYEFSGTEFDGTVMTTRTLKMNESVNMGRTAFDVCRKCAEIHRHRRAAEIPYAIIAVVWVLGITGLLIILASGSLDGSPSAMLTFAICFFMIIVVPTWLLIMYVRKEKRRVAEMSDLEVFDHLKSDELWQLLIFSEYASRSERFRQALRNIRNSNTSVKGLPRTATHIDIKAQMPSGLLRSAPIGRSAVSAGHWFMCTGK